MTMVADKQTRSGRTRLSRRDMFDESRGYDDETGVRVATGLSPDDARQAVVLYRLFNELWGICIVTGDPGTGKDLFGNYIQYKIKKYFPWKRIVRDEKPRELFGEYDALFDEQVIVESLKNMMRIAKGSGDEDEEDEESTGKAASAKLDSATVNWVKGEGEVLLQNSVTYLTEFWRYVYNREPHNPMNKTMGAIHKTKRHLDTLIIGTSQLTRDLDKNTALPWIDWQVTCTRSVTNRTGFVYYVQKVKYNRRRDELLPLNKPFPIAFDAGKPRSDMGDGKIVIKKPHYQPETEEERVVLTVLKAGINTYEELVDVLENDGDMLESEVLDTVKRLSLNIPGWRNKMVLDYPCYLRLFNSKSAVQLTTSLKE